MAILRPWLGIEFELRLAALQALTTIDMSDPALLEAFDEVVACTRETGLSFKEAAERCNRPVVPAMLAILSLGWLHQWDEGGSDALLGLSHGLVEPGDDADEASWTLYLVTQALVVLAVSQAKRASGLDIRFQGEAGSRLAALTRWLEAHGHSTAACECALLAAELQRRAGDVDHHSTGQAALRLLNRAPKRATLPRVPRAKYPARDAPALPPDVTEELVCSMLMQLLIQGPAGTQVPADEFDTIARTMLNDRDWVLHCPVRGEYEAEPGLTAAMPVDRFEMRFATPLLQRVAGFVSLAGDPGISMRAGLIDLVMQLLTHRARIEHRRDPYLHDWYELRGEPAWRDTALFTDVAVCVQSIGSTVFAVVGEHADDIDNWQLFERHAQTARDFLRRARSALA